MKFSILAFTIALIHVFPSNSSAQIFFEQGAVVGVSHTFEPKGLMGGGAAFFDADQDGDDDLFLVGGLAGDDLYQNNGDGTFSKLGSSPTGLDITKQYNTTAVITGDIDNDGDRDVFLSTWETFSTDEVARNLLLENKGDGTFKEIGESAGITHAAFTIGANFVDYNRDGYLDIHVMNHVETPGFLYDSVGVINGFDHDCYDNFFYVNNGDNTFTEAGTALGINDEGCALAALASDYDMDGDPDILIANDFGPFLTPNVLYQNDYPDNSFSDVSAATGANFPIYGMGVACGDYDNDLDFDYYITNLGENVLMENENATFTNVSVAAGVESTYAVGSTTDFATGWGTAFFDVDNDTWLDLFVANGRIPSLPTLPTAFNDPNRLFINNGDKTFTDVSAPNEVDDPSYSRGMAYSDFDGDGDLDFVLVNQSELGGTTKFYRNDGNLGNHYIQFKLEGTESNADGYGAKVWVYAGDQTFLRETDGGGGSFCSQNTSIVHFGLGANIEQVDSVRVDWPNGWVDVWEALDVDQRHVLVEDFMSSSQNLLVASADLKVSPNPFHHSFHIAIAGDWRDDNISLELFNIEGKLITAEKLSLQNGQAIFKAGRALPAGIYTLRVKGKRGTLIQKVIKQ